MSKIKNMSLNHAFEQQQFGTAGVERVNITVWSPGQKDIEAIEKIQLRFTKTLFGLRDYSYSERLQELILQSLELRRIQYDIDGATIEALRRVRHAIDRASSHFSELPKNLQAFFNYMLI